MSESIHISASVVAFGLTNTLLTSMLVVALLILGGHLATRNMSLVPGGWQNAVEWAVESLYNLCQSITNDERKTRMFLPFIGTFFLFIIVTNYFGLLPGVGSIIVSDSEGHTAPLFRAATSDLNLTLGLAVFSLLLTHIYSIRELGWWGYLSHWLPLHPILFLVGILEFFSELTKLVSLSFRLFGNIFAGETVLEVIATRFTPFLLPLPFLALELIVGFVQALVFSLLTLASLVMLTQHHDADEAHT